MKQLKNIFFYSFVVVFIILTTTLFITFLNYYNFINTKLTNIFKIIIPLLSITAGSFLLGKKAKKNGYLEGLKLGILFVLIILIINVIFFNINIKNIIFYILILLTSAFGGMIGINTKKE